MLNAMEQIRRANALGTEASLAIAALSVEGFEHLCSRQLDFARSLLEQQLRAAAKQPASGAFEIEDFAQGCQSQLQSVLDLSRDCLQIGFTTQGEISRRFHAAMNDWSGKGQPAKVPAAPAAAEAEEDAPAKPRRQR